MGKPYYPLTRVSKILCQSLYFHKVAHGHLHQPIEEIDVKMRAKSWTMSNLDGSQCDPQNQLQIVLNKNSIQTEHNVGRMQQIHIQSLCVNKIDKYSSDMTYC